MAKDRLYYEHQDLYDFEAEVTDCAGPFKGVDGSEHWEARLNPNAFYPESGGQPSDRGKVGTADVIDVKEAEDGSVLVLVSAPVSGKLGCSIDGRRRFDHMQQHTGQHILSAAFELLFGYETVGFHLGEEYCTIDLEAERLDEAQADMAEDMANDAVMRDVPVRAAFVDKANLASYNLRKPPKVEEDIRIVTVEGFDNCPCGGTHVSSTGKIGIVKVTRIDRAKGKVRLEFLCGGRALLDYRRKNRQLTSAASALSVHPMELEAQVERMLSQLKDSRKQLADTSSRLMEYDAAKVWQETAELDGSKVISFNAGAGSMDTAKQFALRLVSHPKTAAAVGASSADNAYLVVARSQDLASIDASAAFKSTIHLLGGKGGGNPAMAQGGGPSAAALDEALASAREALLSQFRK